jgi:Flp pilus assembly protein TadB
MLVTMLEKSLYLKKNLSPVHQAIRLLLGIGLVILPVLALWPPWIIAVVAAIGGAQIIEGLIGY